MQKTYTKIGCPQKKFQQTQYYAAEFEDFCQIPPRNNGYGGGI
jgi:hypothetical protein